MTGKTPQMAITHERDRAALRGLGRHAAARSGHGIGKVPPDVPHVDHP